MKSATHSTKHAAGSDDEMIEYRITMSITSADLQEMADKAREIEKTAVIGDSTVIRDWYCGNGVTVHLTVDQERAARKGLMR